MLEKKCRRFGRVWQVVTKMIIDTHVHIFPDKLCPQTIEQLAVTDPDHILTYYGDGSLHCAEKNMEDWGFDLGLILPIATNPKQQAKVNAFALKLQKETDVFDACGSIHPDAQDRIETIEWIASSGLKGIKLHPDYQNFFIQDEKLYPVYEKAAELGLPMVFHTGYDPVSPKCIHATPEGVRQVAVDFPNLVMVAAHTGGLAFYEGSWEIYQDLPNLYFDTAIASYTFTPESYRKIIDFYGAERFIFATDNPWGSGEKDSAFIEALHLSKKEQDLILYQNAQKVFKLLPKSRRDLV